MKSPRLMAVMRNIKLVIFDCVGITRDTAIAIRVVLVLGLFVSCFRLPKEKVRGSKGRAIYRAVGSQVTYATLCGPCRICSARNVIYNLYSYRQIASL